MSTEVSRVYVKVFKTIFDGSLYGKFESTVVFMAMLVIAEREGIVDMTPEALAARCGYPLDIVLKGIQELEQPDPKSRTPDDEGRRIVRLEEGRDWGWRVTNYEKYEKIRTAEERREYFRIKKAEQRAKAKETPLMSTMSTPCPQCPPESTSSSSSSSSPLDLNPKKPDRRIACAAEPDAFIEIRRQYPRRAGGQRWGDALRFARRRIAEGSTWNEILDGVQRYALFAKATGIERTERVQQAATFLGDNRGYLEPWNPPPKAENATERILRHLNGSDDSTTIEHEPDEKPFLSF